MTTTFPKPKSLMETLALYRWKHGLPQEPQKDSDRFRRRIYTRFDGDYKGRFGDQFLQNIGEYLGAHVTVGDWGVHWRTFFEESDLEDVLCAITLLAKQLLGSGDVAAARAGQNWLPFVRDALETERMDYIIDDEGVIRPRVDQAFQLANAMMIEAVRPSHLSAVRAEAEDAFDKLARGEPDTAGAIRAMFVALESVFKLVVSSGKNLDSKNAKDLLTPIIDRVYAGPGGVTLLAAKAQLDAFCDWVNACHQDRHGHEVEEPVKPPLELAVLCLNTGAAYLRWLAGL
jgi:hypothetical protein